jgi:hypothetical protein
MGNSRIEMDSKAYFIAHISILDTSLAITKGQYHTWKDQKLLLADQPPIFLKAESEVSEMLYTPYSVDCGLLEYLRVAPEIVIEVDMSSLR